MAPAAARQRGVVGAAVLRQGFAKLYGGGGGIGEGEGGTKGKGERSSIPPTIYRGPRGGGGQGVGGLPPKQGGAPFRVSPTLGAWALGEVVPQPTLGWVLSHFSPWGPPG